ncbi:Hypothetical predicted protein [Cloeon dipterum]|uniref:Uncharacterized protein n=1 Tax=Cloeon dipterum TaxID=197152 RepID=A0A8S1E5M4_9INSE|nr:Hypothetical predicted protein [Cloeon dipterum]
MRIRFCDRQRVLQMNLRRWPPGAADEASAREKICLLILRHLQARKRWQKQFWEIFTAVPESEKAAFDAFHSAITLLFKKLMLFESTVKTLSLLEPNSGGKFESIVQGVLLAKAPYNHQRVVKMFFGLSFKVFCHSENTHDESLEELICQGCSQESERCMCKEILKKFSEANNHLVRLGLMERLAGEQLRELLQMRIKSYVQELCKGSFSSHLAELESWLETVVMAWLNCVYEEQDDVAHSLVLELSIVKLRHFLYETYTKIRVEEFFNIIIGKLLRHRD